jgi:hypothetical protein
MRIPPPNFGKTYILPSNFPAQVQQQSTELGTRLNNIQVAEGFQFFNPADPRGNVWDVRPGSSADKTMGFILDQLNKVPDSDYLVY